MMLHASDRKTIRAVTAGVARLLLLPTLAWAGICSAQELAPRSQWQASSSSQQVATMAIGHLIDNDPKTVTGGAFSPGHWFQIDVGRPALLGGVRITWDVSNPEGYTLETSLDGKQWDLAYTMGDSLGGIETLFFAPRRARYLRVASPERTSDWGVSILEMEPLDTRDSARVAGLGAASSAALWQGGSAVAIPSDDAHGKHVLAIGLPRPLATAGLVVDWPTARTALRSWRCRTRTASGPWWHATRRRAADSRAGWLATPRWMRTACDCGWRAARRRSSASACSDRLR